MRPRLLTQYQYLGSPNQSSRMLDPTCCVIHYTASRDDDSPLAWLRREESQASAHFLIGRTGIVIQLVPLDRAAWHAGVSEWRHRGETLSNVNDYSVGIELCNAGLLTRLGDSLYGVEVGRRVVPYSGPPPVQATLIYDDGRRVHGYWEPYREEQMQALGHLLEDLGAAGYELELVGHEEIAMPCGRKIDPGPAFEWERLRRPADSRRTRAMVIPPGAS